MTNVPCGEERGETTVFVGYLTTRDIKSTRTVAGRGSQRVVIKYMGRDGKAMEKSTTHLNEKIL